MSEEVFRAALQEVISAIEWAHKTSDGKYRPTFDEAYLRRLKTIVSPSVISEATPSVCVNINSGQKTILYPPTLDWSWMFQRPQQLLAQFAKAGWKVLYANKTQRKGVPPTDVMPNVTVYHDWNALRASIKKVDVLWVSWAMHHDVNIPSKLTVYDCLDDFPDWDKYETSMLKKSQLVFTTSQALYDKHKSHHGNIVMVRNGCDPVYIGSRTYPIPAEFSGLKKPIVGFIGALGSWVDTDVISKIANTYSVVIIGPKLGKEPPPNTHYLGIKEYSQLPCYYANIDVGLIPFLINRTSIAANPIKMYEYMAAGKGVVTSNIPECGLYPKTVFPSRDYSDYLHNIDRALKVDRGLARQIALENSWEERFKIIEREIMKLL